jgi:hypothetical protein
LIHSAVPEQAAPIVPQGARRKVRLPLTSLAGFMSEKASAILHLRITPSLKNEIKKDAATLGVSVACIAKIRLKTGHIVIPVLGN